MQRSKLDNKTLDELGKALICVEARRTPDIDRLIGDPHLFARVKARIDDKAEQQSLAGSMSLPMFFRPQIVAFAGFAGVFALALALAAFSLLKTGNGDVAVYDIRIPDTRSDVARPVFPPQEIETGKLSAGRASDEEIGPAKAAYRRPLAQAAKIRNAANRTKPAAQFYAVAYTGDPAETEAGGRIIRVDLKRSSLFAVGVAIPLENDDEIIKADLLISADGVTRAIRLVE